MSEGETRLGLRIDVDYAAGLSRGVPFFLEELERAGMSATFFVVAGRNAPRPPLRRFLRPGYLRRLWRLGPLAACRNLAGSADMLAAPSARDALLAIEAAGCELAAHGLDHAWWIEQIDHAPADEVRQHLAGAFARLEGVAGVEERAWASPGWRSSEVTLRWLAARGVPYLSECWGNGPFRTRLTDGTLLDVPHLPITLPSLEALVLEGMGEEEAVERVIAAIRPAWAEVLCMHDYFEGLLRPRLFRRFLERCLEERVSVVALRDLAPPSSRDLPSCKLVEGPIPGFSGHVSRQGPEERPDDGIEIEYGTGGLHL